MTSFRVAIYDRNDAQLSGDYSTVDSVRQVCEDQNWQIVGEYLDDASTKNRRFDDLFSDAERDTFDLVLFWSLERFSRGGALRTLDYFRELDRLGVYFRSCTETYLDSTGALKDSIFSFLETMAKQERRRLSEKVKAGMEKARAEGKRISRPRISSEKQVLIRELAGTGRYSLRQIAEQVGVSHRTVGRYLDIMNSDPNQTP